jgi:hypothetical protein
LILLALEFQQLSQSGISRVRPTFSHTQDPKRTFDYRIAFGFPARFVYPRTAATQRQNTTGGGHVYLVGRDGVVKSLLPPILSPERMAELMRKYLYSLIRSN